MGKRKPILPLRKVEEVKAERERLRKSGFADCLACGELQKLPLAGDGSNTFGFSCSKCGQANTAKW